MHQIRSHLPAQAGTASGHPPLTQGWTDTSPIRGDDDWSGVTAIVGYRGDGLDRRAGK